MVWGSNISQGEVLHNVKDFLLNFENRYRMIREGSLNERENLPAGHPGKAKEYVAMMNKMLDYGATALNLDMKNLKAYPSTIKLWHQMQDFPDEIIDLFDNAIKDLMIELAQKRMHELRREKTQSNGQRSRLRQSSSVPPAPSSDAGGPGHQPGSTQQNVDDVPDIVRDVESKVYRVRPFGLDETTNLRDLNPKSKRACKDDQ